MSAKERERLAVIRRVGNGQLKQARAAELLGISIRQVKRLVRAWRQRGDRGLVSERRGKPSNNRLSPVITVSHLYSAPSTSNRCRLQLR